MSNSAEWTILVFLNAKNNLEQYSFPNFLQMASVGSRDGVNIVVEMGRPKEHYTEDYGGWSKTLRFFIRRGDQPLETCALADLGATDMGDITSLVDFVRWGRSTYPAKHTMLVIWNHGQGWRAPPGRPLAPVRQAGGYRYVSTDEDTQSKLYNRAIQDALAELLAGEKLDIIAFDACLMAMVETAYALRGVADIMVASEELEPGSGWDYSRWLQPLVDAKGAVAPEDLARQLVRAMASEYRDLSAATLSAVRLDRSATLAAAISRFADAAIPQLSATTIEIWKRARAACGIYGEEAGMDSIDLCLFMQQIAGSALAADLRARASEVIEAHDATVLDAYASKSRADGYGSRGLAIYFPASARAHAADPDGAGYDADNKLHPVEFVERERWPAFLRAYWELVP